MTHKQFDVLKREISLLRLKQASNVRAEEKLNFKINKLNAEIFKLNAEIETKEAELKRLLLEQQTDLSDCLKCGVSLKPLDTFCYNCGNKSL